MQNLEKTSSRATTGGWALQPKQQAITIYMYLLVCLVPALFVCVSNFKLCFPKFSPTTGKRRRAVDGKSGIELNWYLRTSSSSSFQERYLLRASHFAFLLILLRTRWANTTQYFFYFPPCALCFSISSTALS